MSKSKAFLFALLGCLLIPRAYALTSVAAGPAQSQLGHAGVRYNWMMDTSAFTVWCWDTSSHVADTDCSSYAHKFGSNFTHTLQGMYISGLTAGTPYFARFGGSTGASRTGTIVVSAEQSFTTLALPNPHPALPTAPTPVDHTFPTCANGRIEVCSGGNPVPAVVGADCDDPTTGLVAKYNAAAWGTVIQIPVTTACSGYYHFSKGSWDGIGRMLIESQNAASLPPASRMTPNDIVNMPKVYESFWHHPGSAGGTQDTCYAGGFEWDDNTNTPGWYMHYCGQSGGNGTISGVTYNSHGNSGNGQGLQYLYNMVLSVSTGITPSIGQWGYMTGVGGIPKANGTFQVTAVTDATHFIVQMYNSYNGLTSDTYTSGGTINFFDWQAVSFTAYSGAAPGGSCTPGTTAASAWAYSTTDPGGTPLVGNMSSGTYNNHTYSTGRVWRCTAPNVWSPHYIKYSTPKEFPDALSAVFDMSAATHTWLSGLNVGAQPIFNDPLLYRSGYTLTSGEVAYTQGGSNPGEYIFMQSGTTQDVVVDRCYITRSWPLKGDLLVQLDGIGTVLQNSYLKSTGVNWWGHEDRGVMYDNAGAEIVEAGHANGSLVDNNYLEHYGITVHFFDAGIGQGFAGSNNNITVSRNTFYRNLALIDEAPGSTVNYYTPLRQLLEFKSGVNVDINGNTFINNFQNVSQAAAIALTPESIGGTGLHVSLSYSGSTGTFTVLDGMSYTVNVGDWIACDAQPTVMYQVTAVNTGANTFTVPGMTLALVPHFALVLTGGDGISDVMMRNNTFNNLPTIISNYSHISHDSQPFRISEDRIAFQNNVINQYGPYANGSANSLQLPLAKAWNTSGCTGDIFNIWGGTVDWTVTHNTIYQFNANTNLSACLGISSSNFGTQLLFVNNDFSPTINVQENEGIVFQSNMGWTSAVTDPVSAFSQSGYGSCPGNGNTVLTCWTTGNLPFSMGNNCSYLPGGDPLGYSGSNFWGDYTTSPAQFDLSLRLLYNAVCVSGGVHRAPDGTDQGVDQNAIDAAQGATSTPQVHAISTTTATVDFYAAGSFDTPGCQVDYGSDPNFGIGTYSTQSDSGGALQHSVALSGLTTQTIYYVRVNCQVNRKTTYFRTR